jgi:hypothetical protein
MHPVERATSTFTTQELARLAVYKAAVAAGFYSDGAVGAGVGVDAETQAPAEVEVAATPDEPAR